MKIVAVMITWNNLEFFKRALQQALGFCDEVILSEGCSSKDYPRRSTDGTCEFIETMRGHPKLKIMDVDYSEFKDASYIDTQWTTRKRLTKMAELFLPGNWYTAWDDDQFFFDEDLPKLKHAMETKDFNTLLFRERRFIYNFRFNTAGTGNWYFHRITAGHSFAPLMHLCYADGTVYEKRKEKCNREDFYYFHYPYVKKPERIKARWAMSIEKGTTASIGRFENWMKMEWDQEKDIVKYRKMIENMQGQGHFNIYPGPHPEVLDDHPWRHIEDVRLAA